eukprot:TRINITY_DN659_c0_g1_i7.p1 TRINITY_DN659_c0_g1~~TRINITY_DN659_c0_g1_i7.p1  ORF type:complete len:229 (+),score=42.16 TRINITY_DN659_c0_g1_i7:281-967(+)
MEAEEDLSNAESALNSMGLQVRSLPSHLKDVPQTSVKRYSQLLKDLKADLKRAQLAAMHSRNRETLFDTGGPVTELHVTSLENRDRLVQTTYKMEENSERIRQMRETIAATEDVAEDIMGELAEQRNLMERMLESLRDINGTLDTAKRTMGRIGSRIIMHKFLLLVIILILIAIIIVVVWIKFFWGWGGNDSHNDNNNNNSGGTTSGMSSEIFDPTTGSVERGEAWWR